jgi:hypothetical protein
VSTMAWMRHQASCGCRAPKLWRIIMEKFLIG